MTQVYSPIGHDEFFEKIDTKVNERFGSTVSLRQGYISHKWSRATWYIGEYQTGNSKRKIELLESALETAFSSFDGQEFYPTKEEKGARIGHSLISNHAFVDGNKRIGVYVMLTFLEVNGIRLDCTNEEVVHVGLSVADGSMDYDALLLWIKEHRV